MCIALPGKVLEVSGVEGHLGRVDVLGTPRMVDLSLLGKVAPGDWVLVHLGFAMEKLSEAEAAETARLLEELGLALERDGGGGRLEEAGA